MNFLVLKSKLNIVGNQEKFWLDPVGFLHVFWPLSLATKRRCEATYKRALRRAEENDRFISSILRHSAYQFFVGVLA
jgi:hypothetical protein